jgi:hypothetical protein
LTNICAGRSKESKTFKSNYDKAIKYWSDLREEQKKSKGKKTKKLCSSNARRRALRLEISQEIKRLDLTEYAKQKLIGAIRKVNAEIKKPKEKFAKPKNASKSN